MSLVGRLRQLFWIVVVIGAVALIDSDFVVICAAAIAIVAIAIETRAPVQALGLGRPRSFVRAIVVGIGAGIALLLFSKLLLTPLVEALTGIPRDLSVFDDLRGDTKAYFLLLPRIWLGAAICEEIVFRGFLIGRIEAAFGAPSRLATGAAVLLSSVVFGAAHAYQGPTGIVITGILGLVFAIVFVSGGRNLWLNIVVHGVYDTLSLALVLTSTDRVFSELGYRLIPY
ncbi:MAG TPA: CPBP family intramembrane glutamic endopeptidase [Rhodanobacteraceae bacterium]|nr:CPBP family intramembrane glutamic endopeptidase [Rhodanobacteraceae bacterium]